MQVDSQNTKWGLLAQRAAALLKVGHFEWPTLLIVLLAWATSQGVAFA